MRTDGPIRVLHICYPLIRAGIETWLLNVLKHIDAKRIQFDIAVHSLGHQLEPDYLSHGARIFKIPRADRLPSHWLGLRRLIRDSGPYHVIHSHVHHTGIEFMICRGTKARLVAHAHNDERAFTDAPLIHRLALQISRPWITKYAHAGLACSRRAAAAFFGKHWEKDPRFAVLHYGIDLARFQKIEGDGASFREKLQLPREAVVIGHVGRFAPQKNHAFIIALFPHILQRIATARLLLVGDGPLRPNIEKVVRAAGLESRVHFLGSRPDVPELMTHVFDVLLFPSLHEGLPVTLIEAQAAGCPVVCSDEVPPETFTIPELFRPISLKAPVGEWVEAVCQSVTGTRPRRDECLARLGRSDFDISVGVNRLVDVYFALVNDKPLNSVKRA
jgi:glycosyltransferase involved in cell wall biosynthesis